MKTISMILSKKVWLLASAFVFLPITAYSAAAKVEFAVGNVQASAANGTQRILAKGMEIGAGETVLTNANGRAQLRFSDGGYISLQPNTQFRVDEYKYEGKTDGNEKSHFSLLIGGLRAITGAVGRVNKSNYRVNTPVATIGIRGTEFLAQYDGRLLVKVGNGAVYMSNATGDLVLFSGQSGEVSDENSKPEYSNEEPTVTAAGPQGNTPEEVQQQTQQDQQQSDTFQVAEQYTESGTSCVVVGDCPVTDSAEPTAFKTLENQGIAFAHHDEGMRFELDEDIGVTLTGTIEFDSANRITRIAGEDQHGPFSASNFTGAFVDSSAHGDLSWTRLSGGTAVVTDNEGTKTTNITNVHILYGNPTAASDISALHAQSATGYYDLVGGTRPTDQLGNVGLLAAGSLEVYFGLWEVSANLTVVMSQGPASSGGDGYGTYSVSSWNSELLGNGQFRVSNVGDCSNCFVGVGFLAGVNAGQAGLSYAIDSNTDAGTITGTAAFEKGLAAR